MSVEGFVQHGYHYGLIRTKETESPYGEIKLYDIGVDNLVGAEYVQDRSRQAHPLSWHPGVQRDLLKHRSERHTRPSLRNKERVDTTPHTAAMPTQDNTRPRLGRPASTRPRLQKK